MNKKISKQVSDLIADASVRKKAALYVSKWEDRTTMEQEPLITEAEAEAIVKSLKNNDERIEFNKYVKYYNVFITLAPIFGLAEAQYRGNANQVTGYLRQIEAYIQEENHLNSILFALQETRSDEAVKAFLESLKEMGFQWAKVKVCEDNYIEIDATELWYLAKKDLKDVCTSYELYKALIIATEEYIKKKKAGPFLPKIMKDSIASAKEDYALEVAPRYSRKLLQERIDRGERTTERERERAIFPYYEEINASEEMIERWRRKIASIEKYG